MVVIVRESVVDIGNVEIESVSDGLGVFSPLLDEPVDLADADSSSADMWLTQKVTSDPPTLSLRHI